MIYKIESEFSVFTTEKIRLKVYKKPFKYWPFWTYITTCYNYAELYKNIELLKTSPLYEGSLNQILTQISKKATIGNSES